MILVNGKALVVTGEVKSGGGISFLHYKREGFLVNGVVYKYEITKKGKTIYSNDSHAIPE